MYELHKKYVNFYKISKYELIWKKIHDTIQEKYEHNMNTRIIRSTISQRIFLFKIKIFSGKIQENLKKKMHVQTKFYPWKIRLLCLFFYLYENVLGVAHVIKLSDQACPLFGPGNGSEAGSLALAHCPMSQRWKFALWLIFQYMA